tara:strand:+ start:89 stop:385 length:297 start_codon:yes stop_codon:yes gene_type:complete
MKNLIDYEKMGISRKIDISKYKDNTHYSVTVTDGFGQEHHLGYLNITINMSEIEAKAEEVWQNEVKREVDPLENAINEMVKKGKKFFDERGNYRDGLD